MARVCLPATTSPVWPSCWAASGHLPAVAERPPESGEIFAAFEIEAVDTTYTIGAASDGTQRVGEVLITKLAPARPVQRIGGADGSGHVRSHGGGDGQLTAAPAPPHQRQLAPPSSK